jgi:hypothetical protein
MKKKLIATVIIILLAGSFCYSQPGQGPMKPPGLEERMKMVSKRICKPLNIEKDQTAIVTSAFKDFFVEMDKLMDKSTNPPSRPEKSKVDALAKIREDKIKLVIPEALFPKYLELELATRLPKGPGEGAERPK